MKFSLLVGCGRGRPYLYADKAGDKPVQYELPINCWLTGGPEGHFRYRKKSWPSEHWCEFATNESSVMLPVRPGSFLKIEGKPTFPGARLSAIPWTDPVYVTVDEDGNTRNLGPKEVPNDWVE